MGWPTSVSGLHPNNWNGFKSGKVQFIEFIARPFDKSMTPQAEKKPQAQRFVTFAWTYFTMGII